MRCSRIKENLAKNQLSLCVQLHLTDASIFEMVALMGFDAIWMDLEHHGYSIETAANLMRAARVGTTDIVARPGKGEFMRLSRLLEVGAQAIMYPRCESAAEAAEVVRWSKYAPLGARGFDGSGADGAYMATPLHEYIEHANRETTVIIQLEDQQAVEQAEAIASVPGVDMIMLGPADYSILSGFPGKFDDPRIQKSLETISAAARNTGKSWAYTSVGPTDAANVAEMGCRLIFNNADIVMVREGLEAMRAEFGSLGVSFANGRTYHA